ncbi:unannotated protein [freshwater metagenome]|uniref:Unannotated protein n=1 Tax=freshwater metagenome TaxID=449393 RepID=A0A6J7XT46_9ZZZZ|nr:PDZ domain-containing protein [Actinomycetota bacterium]
MTFFQRNKNKFSTTVAQPWWEASQKRNLKKSKSTSTGAIAIAVTAGVFGGIAIVNFDGGILGHRVNLVSVNNSIERAPNSVAGIAARVLPSVVSISTVTSTGGGTGSGFIIDENGYILTNNHVVQDAATSDGTITVTLNDGTEFKGKIIGRDAAYDLAVLKISATKLPAMQFGDSDKVAVGDAVLAVGSPLGLSGTVTLGIISAKDRAVTAGESGGTSSFINALQTDAAVNPGNSGGPLVDSTGAVIGVNSAIASLGISQTTQSGSIGLGFAIPINQARKTASQLIKTGKATYPVIGVSVDMGFTGEGAKISNVSGSIMSGGPAQKAGLKAGDVIVGLDNKTISSAEELIVYVRSKSVGDRVSVKYLRGTTTTIVSLVLVAGKN